MTIQAIYEHGVLRPKEPLGLKEGSVIQIIVVDPAATATDAANINVADALADIAALPIEGPDDGFTGRNHDDVLYPPRGKAP